MYKPNQPAICIPLRQTMALLAIAAMWYPQALAQSNPTTEYIRAGGRTLAILHMPAPDFTDLSGYPTYANEANLLGEDKISAGSSCPPATSPAYCPTAVLTRDEMAVFVIASLYVALQGPGNTSPLPGWPTTKWTGTAGPNGQYFTDVPPSNNYYNFIQQMRYLGITGGCLANPPMYCPTANTTNAEMAVFAMTARQFVLTGATSTAFTYPATPCFTDVLTGDPYFPFVQALTALNVIPYGGLTCGTGIQFGESNAITRIQATPYAVRGILGEQSY
jgi:hypothetical protein